MAHTYFNDVMWVELCSTGYAYSISIVKYRDLYFELGDNVIFLK